MKGFEFGRWKVLPERGLVRDGEEEIHLEPKVMDVFVLLASHEGEVVNRDQLVDAVWDGRAVTDEVITRSIAVLRRNLGDDAKSPQFVETLPRRGYRVMIPVVVPDAAEPDDATPSSRQRRGYLLPLVAGFGAVAVIAWYGLKGPKTIETIEQPIASIAVFPFECLQDQSNQNGHLCFGFAEEAISGLNRIEDLKVVRFRQPYELGSDVNAHGLVTGSVQIIGADVKISAQLEDVRSGIIVWSATFDADKDNIFVAQKQVAAALRAAIDGESGEQVAKVRTPASFAAEEAFSLGRYLFEQREHKATLGAIEQFEEAIELDPSFGPAYLSLAYTYIIWPDYDLSVDREIIYDKALQVVERGIRADPGIREAAGTVTGFVYNKRLNWGAAAEAFEMAISADTVQPIAHHWYSRALASVGRLDAALEHAKRALELDPNHPEQPIMISRLAIAYFWGDDMENAARYFEIANRMDLQAPMHSMAYSLFLIRSGRIEEAKIHAKIALEQNDVETKWINPVFDGFNQPEKRQRANDIVAEMSAEDALPATVELSLWALLGETDRVMAIVRRLEETPSLFELELLFIQEFKPLRQHADFPAFAQAIGLTEYWSSAGCTWSPDRVSCAETGD
jgi:DNA-binding winged helix-turn-helix (wHTH) protein/TolB-like protein/lipoprotein NlpI